MLKKHYSAKKNLLFGPSIVKNNKNRVINIFGKCIPVFGHIQRTNVPYLTLNIDYVLTMLNLQTYTASTSSTYHTDTLYAQTSINK